MALCKVGCWKPRSQACSAWRGKPEAAVKARASASVLDAGPVGRGRRKGPPISGWPICVRCTRIWWGAPGLQPALDQRGEGALGPEGFDQAVARTAPPCRRRAARPLRLRSKGLRPMSPSMTPAAGAWAPPRRRRGRRARSCGWRTAWRGFSSRASFLAATRRPLVSLSRRWTMPGRVSPPMPIEARARNGRSAH